MKSNLKFVLGIFVFLIVFANINFVDASIDTVILNYDSDGVNYNYSVIGKTYDLYIAGLNLEVISDSQLHVESNNSDLIFYTFIPGNFAGLRVFGEGENQFNISVLSEADELVDSVGEVVITLSDTSSSVEIKDFDLNERLIRMLDVSEISDLDINYLLDTNLLLNGLTFDISFNEGSSYPQYNELVINSSTSINVIENLMRSNGLPSYMTVDRINEGHSEYLNEIIDAYGGNENYSVNAYAIKSGGNFEFYSEEGYSVAGSDDLTNAQEIIREKIKYLDPIEIIDALIPLGNFSEFSDFVDFNTSVDFGNLSVLVSGEYRLNLIYTDSFGNNGTMPFIVNLNVTNEGEAEEVDSNGTVTFTDPVISQRLERIENLPQNVSLTSVLYGTSRPASFSGDLPSTLQPLEFMEIDSSNDTLTDNGVYILYFKISTSSILSTQKENVSLYVQEGVNWIQLPTSFINESSGFYNYNATVNHFSNYLIGYTQEESPIERSSRRKYYPPEDLPEEPLVSISPERNGDPEEVIVLGEDPKETSFFRGITGAVVGVLSSPGGIFSSIFIFILIALFVALRIKKKKEFKKKSPKKLNLKGDKIGKK